MRGCEGFLYTAVKWAYRLCNKTTVRCFAFFPFFSLFPVPKSGVFVFFLSIFVSSLLLSEVMFHSCVF